MKTCLSFAILIALGLGLGVFGLTQVAPSSSTIEPPVGVGPTPPPAIGYFTADTTVIPAGGCVNLSWSYPDAVAVTLSGSNWPPEALNSPQPNTGTAQVCPSAALYYVPNEPVTYVLNATFADRHIETQVIVITYSNFVPTVPPNFPFTPTFPPQPFPSFTPSPGGPFPTFTPTPFVESFVTIPPTWTPVPVVVVARYQAFEHGFMLQRTGENCAYAFAEEIIMPVPQTGFGYCTSFDGLPANPVTDTPPAGVLIPEGVFGQVWGNYAEVRSALGYATAAEFFYDGVIPPIDSTGYFYDGIMTLPDGRQLYCGIRGSTAGTCYLRIS